MRHRIVHITAYLAAENRGWSLCRIDTVKLAADIAAAVANLEREGYEVVTITPITSGRYSASEGFSYGYSLTEAVIITARMA